MTIRVIARGHVQPEKIGEFRTLLDEMVAAVREKEAGKTLAYDFYFDAEATEANCAVHEAYSDAAAMVGHLQNLAPFRGRLGRLMQTSGIEFFGPVPPALLDQVRAIAAVSVHSTVLAEL